MGKIKVLIVEDERLAAEDLTLRLESLRCEVIGIASTGNDALKLTAEKNPDIILMDIQLRGKMDGIEAAKIIHETQPVPVIFATAYGDDLHISRALKDANPYGFLHKPVDDQAAQTMMQIALSRFEKDQIILRINQLLQIKDELFAVTNNADSPQIIIENAIQVFAKAKIFNQAWIALWCCGDDSILQAAHGIDEASFEDYVKTNIPIGGTKLKSFALDKAMSELTQASAFHNPIVIDHEIRGHLGFTCLTTSEWDSKEIMIINDISQVLGQNLNNSRLRSEKIETQRAISESESRLKAIVEKSTTGIYQVNDQYQFEYVNDRLCEILGRDQDEINGHSFLEFLGESKELVARRYAARQAGEDVPSEYEIDLVRPNGEVRDIIISANSFKDATGAIKSTGHLLDITDSKKANLEFIKLSKAVEQSPVMTIITDVDGNIEYVNAEFTRVSGYSASESIGNNPRFLKSGHQDEAFYKDMWDTITNGEIWSGELTNLMKNGDIRYEKASIAPIRDSAGMITHYVGLKEDITKIKYDEVIAEKNQKLKDVLYEITSAAIKANDVAILYEKIYHYISDIISTSNFLMAILNKEDGRIYFPFDRDYFETEMPESIPCDPVTSLTARTILAGESQHIKGDEIRDLMGDGQIRLAGDVPSVWLGIPLIVNDDVIGAFVLQEYGGITQYDDEDVRMLSLAAGQVALTIDRVRKDDALRELAEELSNANGMKELLLDVITHDLRNPAGVISSVSEMLEAEDEENEMFEILRGSSASLMKVIENATVLSKLSIGESISKENIDLVELIHEVAADFASQLSTANMTLNLDLPKSLVVKGNPILAEVPRNYISNAIKYASEGGAVDLILTQEDGRIYFRVNDYGTPIPEDKRLAVFHRSIQLAQGEKKGRGLGLAIVKRIADEHHAEVGVDIAPNGGNSFYLKL